MPGAPEELRFDFARPPADELGEPAGTDVPAALQSRVREVRNVAARRAHRPAGAFEQTSADDAAFERPTVSARSGDKAGNGAANEAGSIEPSLSIAEFYERVRAALQKEFDGELWVTGEIRGLRVSRGHRYLELVDHGAASDGRVAQQLEVVCWSRDWPTVAYALSEAGVELEVGRVVRVRGRVSVWEGGSKLRFTLTALDVEALVGGIAAARRRLLRTLELEGLLEANRRLPDPLVPLRIGIVTSRGSEGHRDFLGQLERSGYSFTVHLESSLVQGPEAPAQLASALLRLQSFEPDLAVIVRGGGARADLAAFDAEVVARAIAKSPFPIWSGIGHSGDRSVADEVVQRSCITPTECGKAVVETVGAYVDEITRKARRLESLVRNRLSVAEQAFSHSRRVLGTAVHHQLDRRSYQLEHRAKEAARCVGALVSGWEEALFAARRDLAGASVRLLTKEAERMEHHQAVLRAYDPLRQLERGWSLSCDESGVLVRSVRGLLPGQRLVTRYVDGSAWSRVETVEQRGGSDGER